MTGSVRRRLVAFVLLSVFGVLYASANYLGLVDRVLGRGYSVTAVLETTGGLYEGSAVTYRGVLVGKVHSMEPRGDKVAVRVDLEDEAKVPKDSPMFVHNGSAVGEQYLDFEPPSDKGPFLREGDTIEGDADSIPVDEGDLLVDLNTFIGSVDKPNLRTVIGELGQLFNDTGRPLGDLIDGSGQLVDAATESQDETIRLLRNGRTVLRTQAENADNIKAFASGLAEISGALRSRDPQLRQVLQGGPGAAREIETLMEDLEPTLPVLLGNLVTVNQITVARLASVEQLLVTYPVIISSGFTGTTRDGYGHVHLEYTNEPPPCTEGYKPPSQWRDPLDVRDAPTYLKARCASPSPYTSRGSNYAPAPQTRNYRVAPYDPRTGTVVGTSDQVLVSGLGVSGDVYGKDAWKWMLIGPTLGQAAGR
jgi:phospholipid/cholesterol/gamma-HCH transport system substrate-binding protein